MLPPTLVPQWTLEVELPRLDHGVNALSIAVRVLGGSEATDFCSAYCCDKTELRDLIDRLRVEISIMLMRDAESEGLLH